ncbi:MAG: hypothetical protein NZ889_00475 [Candidatus Pacearchaeota archaeon]|nr:hypothetical protein [Candidatus Pacearchaeota archaeon]
MEDYHEIIYVKYFFRKTDELKREEIPIIINNKRCDILTIQIFDEKNPYITLVLGEIVEKNNNTYILRRIKNEEERKRIEKIIKKHRKTLERIVFLE